MKIVLISCVSKKLPYKAKARDLYVSPLFRLGLKYAESLRPDRIFVLSAEHGLVDLEKEIEPYNKTLNAMSSDDVRAWAERVLLQLRDSSDLANDEFIFLAGERYRKHLVPHIANYVIPLKGLGIGRQLKYLKEATPHE
ncbi:Uncharacterised protein [uncultured archaeon]|nr:Uncharacterised protein [uncultured archaeon]